MRKKLGEEEKMTHTFIRHKMAYMQRHFHKKPSLLIFHTRGWLTSIHHRYTEATSQHITNDNLFPLWTSTKPKAIKELLAVLGFTFNVLMKDEDTKKYK